MLLKNTSSAELLLRRKHPVERRTAAALHCIHWRGMLEEAWMGLSNGCADCFRLLMNAGLVVHDQPIRGYICSARVE